MSEVKLFIAASLDGYIARKDNSLGFLNDIRVEGEDYGYSAFLDGIDVIVMGRSTYQEILAFGVQWPYESRQIFIVSTNKDLEIPTPNTSLINTYDEETIQTLKDQSEKGVWLVGGGKLIKNTLAVQALDSFVISIIPVLLGDGIPLFPKGFDEQKLNLEKVDSFASGVVNLHYKK